MAIQIMTQVWNRGPQRKDPMLIMLALADYADECGECYPSIALLQQKGRMSRSSVLRVLKLLTDEGWLTVQRRSVEADDGRARGNLYCVNMERLGLVNPGRKAVRRPQVEANKRAPRGVRLTPHEKPALEANKRAPRGVRETPHENSVRCQETPREVSGVKSPPAPPLVGEPSLTTTTPLPPASGGSDLDPDARVSEIASLESQVKAAPRLSPEYFAIAARLARLRREEPKPQARDGDRAVAIKPPPADAALEDLARWVMGSCGIFEDPLRKRPLLPPALSHVLGAADPPARPQRAALMVAAWQEYRQGPARWSPKNFFLQGHWQSPASWPRDPRVFDPCAPANTAGRLALA